MSKKSRHLAAASLVAAVFLCEFQAAAASDRYTLWPSPMNRALRSKVVTEIYQDRQGAMWVATHEGLSRYDGKTVSNFSHEPADPNSLSAGSVVDMVETADGRLWVATTSGVQSIDIFQREDFVTQQIPGQARRINDLHLDTHGDLWVFTTTGTYVFDPDPRKSERPITRSDLVVPVIGSRDGTILYGIDDDNRVLRLTDRNNEVVAAIELQLPPTADIRHFALSQGRFWFATASGELFYSERGQDKITQVPTGQEANTITGSPIRGLQVIDGRLLIATTQGILISSDGGETFHRYNAFTSGLTNDFTESFHISRDGVLWIGTQQGITQGTEVNFRLLSTTNSDVINDYVSAIVEDPRTGTLFIGSDGGVDIVNPDGSKINRINSTAFPGMGDNVVTALSLDTESEELLIGTFEAGAYRFDPQTSKLSPLNLPGVPDGASISVTSLLPSNPQQIILNTWGSGVFRIDAANDSITPIAGPSNISSTLRLADGTTLFGAQEGIWALASDADTAELLDVRPAGVAVADWTPDLILAMGALSDGRILVSIANTGVFSFTLSDPILRSTSDWLELPSTSTLAMLPSASGDLWLSHAGGLSVIRSNGSVEAITTEYGDNSIDFNHAAAYVSTRDGDTLYFGTATSGTVIVDSTSSLDSVAPQLSVSQVRIAGEAIGWSPARTREAIQLAFDDSIIDFEVFLAEYFDPASVTYQYRIRGLGNEQINPRGFERTISLTTLPPGEYTVEVAAKGVSGQWNWGLQIPVVQAPPPPKWYETSTFYTLAALGVLLFVVGIYLTGALRLRASRLRTAEMEQAVADRTVELERANAAKSDFLAMMSHELRTPINGIIGLTSLVQEEQGISTRGRRFLDQSQGAAKTLLGLVNDTLDLSKIEQGTVELEDTDFSLVETVGSVVYLQSEAASQKRLDLVFHVIGEPGSLYRGDSQKVWQMVTNLVSNALKFTEEGGVMVSLATTPGNVIIDVVDSGIGVSDEARERIFQSYTQADASTTRRFGGTGLGLSISRRFAEAMGGGLTLENEQTHLFTQGGPGSCFRLTLPLQMIKERKRCDDPKDITLITTSVHVGMGARSLAQWKGHTLDVHLAGTGAIDNFSDYVFVDENCPREVFEAVDALPEDTKKYLLANVRTTSPYARNTDWTLLFKPLVMDSFNLDRVVAVEMKEQPHYEGRVLVCEDNAMNALLFEEVLSAASLPYTVAPNGAVGVDEFTSGNYDLVLMDLQMPVMDGFEATEKIRAFEIEQEREPVPIIAMSAGVSVAERDRATSVGITEFVSKPVPLPVYDRIFSTYLKHSGAASSSTDASSMDEPLEGPLLDHEALKSILSLSPTAATLFPKLTEQFEVQSAVTISELKRAIENEDASAVRSVVHSMKSTAANLGAAQLAHQLSIFEKEARDNNKLPTTAQVTRLFGLISASKREIDTWIAENVSAE